jgi:hypothetical protein
MTETSSEEQISPEQEPKQIDPLRDLKRRAKLVADDLVFYADLANIENNITELLAYRRNIELDVRRFIQLSPEPKHMPQNYCLCKKKISGTRIRCLACHIDYLTNRSEKKCAESSSQ